MKHTKGNWELNRFHNGYDIYVGVKKVCSIWNHLFTDVEYKSNAKLISKAPEMYEALKEIKIISKRLNLWVGIDTIIDPLIKQIES